MNRGGVNEGTLDLRCVGRYCYELSTLNKAALLYSTSRRSVNRSRDCKGVALHGFESLEPRNKSHFLR